MSEQAIQQPVVREAPALYRPRYPDRTALYRLVWDHFEDPHLHRGFRTQVFETIRYDEVGMRSTSIIRFAAAAVLLPATIWLLVHLYSASRPITPPPPPEHDPPLSLAGEGTTASDEEPGGAVEARADLDRTLDRVREIRSRTAPDAEMNSEIRRELDEITADRELLTAGAVLELRMAEEGRDYWTTLLSLRICEEVKSGELELDSRTTRLFFSNDDGILRNAAHWQMRRDPGSFPVEECIADLRIARDADVQIDGLSAIDELLRSEYIPTNSEAALELVRECLRAEDLEVRIRAAEMLPRFGSAGAPLARELVEAEGIGPQTLGFLVDFLVREGDLLDLVLGLTAGSTINRALAEADPEQDEGLRDQVRQLLNHHAADLAEADPAVLRKFTRRAAKAGLTQDIAAFCGSSGISHRSRIEVLNELAIEKQYCALAEAATSALSCVQDEVHRRIELIEVVGAEIPSARKNGIDLTPILHTQLERESNSWIRLWIQRLLEE